MDSSTRATLNFEVPSRLSTRVRDNRFYFIMACATALGVFGGFARLYYLKSYFHTPELPLLLHVHAAIFTIWLFFFILQTALIWNGRFSAHRWFGWAGAISCRRNGGFRRQRFLLDGFDRSFPDNPICSRCGRSVSLCTQPDSDVLLVYGVGISIPAESRNSPALYADGYSLDVSSEWLREIGSADQPAGCAAADLFICFGGADL
jgi:hypothetical protein